MRTSRPLTRNSSVDEQEILKQTSDIIIYLFDFLQMPPKKRLNIKFAHIKFYWVLVKILRRV